MVAERIGYDGSFDKRFEVVAAHHNGGMDPNPYQPPKGMEKERKTIRTWQRIVIELLVMLALLYALYYKEVLQWLPTTSRPF